MPIDVDKDGRRFVEVAFEVPGTPEQVWQAIATGPGIGAWFVPSEVEEHVGGAVTFHLGGGMDSSGQVTVWQPPHRFALEEPNWSGEAPPLGTEFIVEALSGGTCRVRLVHSLEATDPHWDDEIGGMETGWPPFFEVLAIYLGGFAGQAAASARPMQPHPGSVDEAWAELSAALGLAGAQAGGRHASSPPAPPLAGVVQRLRTEGAQREALIRLEAPAPGAALVGVFRWAEQTQIAASLYFYGEGCEAMAAREAARWEGWLAERFPA